jgi:hypothetical protein
MSLLVEATTQADHLSRQTDSMERQIALQEAGMAQWIDINNWRCEPTIYSRDQYGKETMVSRVTVHFDIVNPTGFILVVPRGNMNWTLGAVQTRHFMGDGMRLTPRKPHTASVQLDLTNEQSDRFVKAELMITVQGNLDFVDVLQRAQPHLVSGILWCSITGGPRFQSDVIWEHRTNGQNP